jgi:hypothetical protein
MQTDVNENLPQRNTELMGRQLPVIIKRHRYAFSKALKRLLLLFYYLPQLGFHLVAAVLTLVHTIQMDI